MVIDKNLNLYAPKQQSIFPDEEDSDEASCFKFYRSSEGGEASAVAPFDCGESIRLKKLQQWKHTSVLFKACKVLRCDPLRKFTAQRTCKACAKILPSEYKKMCLTWKRKTLRHAILDYLYFHAIRVFDSDAEATFSKENPDHPYLVCYKKVREFNALLVNSLGTAYQFDLPIRAAVKEHSSMYWDNLKTATRICEICDSVAKRKFVLKGRSYSRKNFKLMKRIVGSQRSQEFCFCADHALLFTTYYDIVHMDWNVHWNCYNWVCNSRDDQFLSAENLIDLINPVSFKYLVTFCMRIYLRLDRLSYFGPKNKWMNNLNSEWSMMAKRWKRSAIFQFNEEKNSRNNSKEKNSGSNKKKS